MTISKQQLLEASVLGTIGFKNKLNAPYQDNQLMQLLDGRKVGITPKKEASSVEIMKAWTNAWHDANIENKF